MDVERIFTEKYIKNSWMGSESKSGPGSSLHNNQKLLSMMYDFFKNSNIKSILDYGCGDFNWMKHFDFESIEKYLGVDIVEEMIIQNRENYETEKIKFKKLNIIDDYIKEKFDAILCKDVLFHLSYEDALSVIDNIKKSGSTYLLSTTFIDFINKDINTGQWRPINLEIEPFNLGEPIIIWKNIEDKKEGWITKSIGIWKIN
jgi:2-polyprenyl-3-methyl-5-hydroxy-6-metoxy-1,4-benzoquinol methylase